LLGARYIGIGDEFGIVFHYARSPNREALEQPLELLGIEP
jgi:hypothetical protein